MSGDEERQRPIRIVLDTSAIIEFTRQSIHVGELIAEVDDEQCAIAISVLSLAEALHSVADRDRLDLLVDHATVVLSADAADWRALAATYDIVGRLDTAAAALAAIDHDCAVLTRRPSLYAGLAGGGPVIPIED
ncbi:hypothetical protein [Luedemannella helvata]|uniref:Uncharacterized protein n=1 Tax=Luedemannella helvata TaxID=349315 RepID=A0ABP4W6U1_9ACTN